jgi:hypothetical protein
MQIQTATVNPPVRYNENTLTFPKDETKVSLEIPRYVFEIGDFIEPGDKRQLRGIGGWTGGIRIGPSSTEGAPTMYASNYIINRACFTPLQVANIRAKMDESPADVKSIRKVGEDEQGNPINLHEILPGSDMLLLGDDSHRQQGIVEITALRGVLFGAGEAQALNRIFFPDLDAWLGGETEFPVLLNDYINLIRAVRPNSDREAITQEEMLESGRRFETYARNQIEENRQAIARTRQTDMGGFGVRWSERTRLFARQLGIALEDDNAFIPQKEDKSQEIEMRAREIAAQEKANELKLIELELLQKRLEAETKPKTVK